MADRRRALLARGRGARARAGRRHGTQPPALSGRGARAGAQRAGTRHAGRPPAARGARRPRGAGGPGAGGGPAVRRRLVRHGGVDDGPLHGARPAGARSPRHGGSCAPVAACCSSSMCVPRHRVSPAGRTGWRRRGRRSRRAAAATGRSTPCSRTRCPVDADRARRVARHAGARAPAGLRRRSDQARARRVGGRRRARRLPELGADVGHVPVDGVGADDQPAGDLGVAEPVGDEPQDLAFALAQRRRRSPFARAGRVVRVEERGERAEDGVAVADPGRMGVAVEGDQPCVGQQRRELTALRRRASRDRRGDARPAPAARTAGSTSRMSVS